MPGSSTRSLVAGTQHVGCDPVVGVLIAALALEEGLRSMAR